jgi:uncharacterized protein
MISVKIKLHPSSSQEKIAEVEKDKEYEVWIKEKPIDGKANKELVKILKKYFKKDVSIIHGLKSRDKVVEIID